MSGKISMLLAEKKLFLIIKSVRTLCEVRVEHTAGLPISKTHKKHQFADKPEGLRQFRDHHWKALGKENLNLPGFFFVINFSNFLFNITSQIMSKQKEPGRFEFTSSNTIVPRSQTLLRCLGSMTNRFFC